MSKSFSSKNIYSPIFVTLVAATLSASVWAQSPPNIATDIKWTYNGGLDVNGTSPPPADFGSVAIIEAAFNNARRQEELQLGLTANKITDLDLPTQTDWDGMSDDQKALYILNAERTSRAGMQTNVIGLPFTGVESAIDMIADAYVDVLIDNNATGHDQPSGNASVDGIFAKIDNSATLGNCHSNIARGENIAWFGVSAGNSIPLPVERAIYRWIYDDASSNWGHREMALLQDLPLGAGVPGFTNDNGDAAHEGYIGFSSKGSSSYQPFLPSTTAFSQAVVMQFFDPIPSGGTNNCSFAVTQTTETLPAAGANTTTTPVTTTPATTTPAATTNSGGGSVSFGLLAGLFGLFSGLRRRARKS